MRLRDGNNFCIRGGSVDQPEEILAFAWSPLGVAVITIKEES